MSSSEETEWTEEKSASVIEQLEARLSKLEASLSEIVAALQEEPEEPEEPEEDTETASLKERIGTLEMERDRAVWETTRPAALAYTADLSEILFGVWRADKDRVHAVLSEAAQAAPTKRAPLVEDPAPVNPFAVQLSEPAGAPTDAPQNDDDISAEALRRADGDQVKALQIYRALKAQVLN